jgi:hypothetical protein
MYAAEQRLACFVETLAPYRPHGDLLAALRERTRGIGAPLAGVVPADWTRNRLIGRLRLLSGQRWLDLRVNETVEALRWEMALPLHDLGYAGLDLSNLLSRDRRLTQAIAAWSFDAGYQGIAYTSRFGSDLDCWAVFEGAAFAEIEIARIASDDVDLLTAATRFMLNLEP